MMSKKNRIKAEHKEREEKYSALMKPISAPFAVLAKNKGKPFQTSVMRGFQKEVSKELKVENEKFYQRQIAAILWAVYTIFKCSPYKLIEFAQCYKEVCKSLTDFYDEDYSKESCTWVFEDVLKRETGIDVHKEFIHEMLPPRNDGRDWRGRFVKKNKEAA